MTTRRLTATAISEIMAPSGAPIQKITPWHDCVGRGWLITIKYLGYPVYSLNDVRELAASRRWEAEWHGYAIDLTDDVELPQDPQSR